MTANDDAVQPASKLAEAITIRDQLAEFLEALDSDDLRAAEQLIAAGWVVGPPGDTMRISDMAVLDAVVGEMPVAGATDEYPRHNVGEMLARRIWRTKADFERDAVTYPRLREAGVVVDGDGDGIERYHSYAQGMHLPWFIEDNLAARLISGEEQW